jgi:hypothetical protein
MNTGVDHTCSNYTVPEPDACKIYATNPPADTEIEGWSSTSIAGYNVYEYGLGIWMQDPGLYSGTDAPYGYIGKYLTDESATEVLINKFPKKNIKSVQGAKDACNCGSINFQNMQNEWCYPTVNPPSIPPNPNTPFCTTNLFGGMMGPYTCCDTWPDSFAGVSGNDQAGGSCREMLGGTNRLQRAMNYKSHLEGFFAARGVDYTLPMKFFLGQHNSSAFSLSEAVAELAYGNGWGDYEMPVAPVATTTTTTACCAFATAEIVSSFFTNAAIKYKCLGFDLPKYHDGMLFGGGTAFLPLYTSLPMNQVHKKITKVAIWFHGALCNADEYFCEGVTSAEAANAMEDTLVIAPLFFIYKISGKYCLIRCPPMQYHLVGLGSQVAKVSHHLYGVWVAIAHQSWMHQVRNSRFPASLSLTSSFHHSCQVESGQVPSLISRGSL